MAYDIKNWSTLGALDAIIEGVNADKPSAEDVKKVTDELASAISVADDSLAHRLQTQAAITQGRKASILVRTKLAEQWN